MIRECWISTKFWDAESENIVLPPTEIKRQGYRTLVDGTGEQLESLRARALEIYQDETLDGRLRRAALATIEQIAKG